MCTIPKNTQINVALLLYNSGLELKKVTIRTFHRTFSNRLMCEMHIFQTILMLQYLCNTHSPTIHDCNPKTVNFTILFKIGIVLTRNATKVPNYKIGQTNHNLHIFNDR